MPIHFIRKMHPLKRTVLGGIVLVSLVICIGVLGKSVPRDYVDNGHPKGYEGKDLKLVHVVSAGNSSWNGILQQHAW